MHSIDKIIDYIIR